MRFFVAALLFLFCVGVPDAVFVHKETVSGFETSRGNANMSTVSNARLACFAVQNHDDFLRLVNKDNPLPSDYRPTDLVRFHGTELREPARDAFAEMLAEMESEGVYGLHLQSAYRCYTHQTAIFEDKMRLLMAKGHDREEAAHIAAQSVQPPGASEHQLGLALDVSINGQLSGAFANTTAGRWIEENCCRFGFVVRYPQGKSNITRIIYEPWHLRFVGIPHAQIMYENDITLEEYRHFLAQFFMYIVWDEDGYFLVRLSGDEVVAEKNFSPQLQNFCFTCGEYAIFHAVCE